MKLTDYASNVHSQAGEDGVIAKLFELIGSGSQFCIEFGAWDGFHLSNTANLWTKGWRGVLIEASRRRYERLARNVGSFPCTCVHATVASRGERSLEGLLDRAGFGGQNIDFLSIDIDGDDYHVLAGLRRLRPRVICCEFNPTIPLDRVLVGAEGSGFGCSARALCELGQGMGYRVAAMTPVNCFLVHESEFGKLSGFETDPAALFPAGGLITVMTAYDGSYLLTRRPSYGLRGPFAGQLAIGEGVRAPEGRLVTWARALSETLSRIRGEGRH
jgi:hypothetical protein